MARLSSISLSEYAEFLHRLWPGAGLPSRLGIALSGGVDSMALAYLTSRLFSSHKKPPSAVYAFIVDHKARPESTAEARSVAQLAKETYGFTTHVLPLAWTLSPADLSNGFETRARIARYQALGRSCVENQVEKLLLAHHADDRAETVLMRLLTGGKMQGLAGMRAVAGIPECGDIFGAEKVTIGRPLLGVEKGRLRATCLENEVHWFEDKTNQDATLTRRNAVRKLLGASPPRLPRALQRPSLVALARRAETRNKSIKDQARIILKEDCNLSFDPATGSLQLQLPPEICGIQPRVLQNLLVQVAETVSPLPRAQTQSLQTAFKNILSDQRKPFTAAGLKWTYLSDKTWFLQRQNYSSKSRNLCRIVFIDNNPGWTSWHLWDGRWWIRLFVPTPHPAISIQAMEERDIGPLREKAAQLNMAKQLEKVLKEELRGDMRFVIPAVCCRGEVLGLPSVGLWLGGGSGEEGAKCEVMFRGRGVLV